MLEASIDLPAVKELNGKGRGAISLAGPSSCIAMMVSSSRRRAFGTETSIAFSVAVCLT